MPTNSFPIAGAREFANRLMLNVHLKWRPEFSMVERDVLCYLIADTVGQGEVSRVIHPRRLGALVMFEDATDEMKGVIDTAMRALIKRGIVLADEADDGCYEVMVNLRWKPETEVVAGSRGAAD